LWKKKLSTPDNEITQYKVQLEVEQCKNREESLSLDAKLNAIQQNAAEEHEREKNEARY
jgi:hypothetical protein